jgi:hypothetical protein
MDTIIERNLIFPSDPGFNPPALDVAGFLMDYLDHVSENPHPMHYLRPWRINIKKGESPYSLAQDCDFIHTVCALDCDTTLRLEGVEPDIMTLQLTKGATEAVNIPMLGCKFHVLKIHVEPHTRLQCASVCVTDMNLHKRILSMPLVDPVHGLMAHGGFVDTCPKDYLQGINIKGS